MRKALLIITMIIMIAGVAEALDTTNNAIFYSFDDSDRSGNTIYNLAPLKNPNATNTNGVLGGSGVFGEDVEIDDATDYVLAPDAATYDNKVTLTLAFWYKGTDTTTEADFLSKSDDSGTPSDVQYLIYRGATTQYVVCSPQTSAGSGVANAIYSAAPINNGSWVHVACTIEDAVRTKLYINGINVANSSSWVGTWNVEGAEGLVVGDGSYKSGGGMEGEYDDVAVFTDILTTAEINELRESGNPYYTPASENPNIEISAFDYYDNDSITSFTVTLTNGTAFPTTNGTVYLRNVTIGSYTFNVTYGNYFNVTNDVTVNAAANNTVYHHFAYPHQTELRFQAYELITNNSLPNSTFYVNASSGTVFKLTALTNWLILAENAGYFNKSTYLNTTALQNETINITGIYSSLVTINATNAYTGNPITNFSGWIYHPSSGYNESYSTTNGTATTAGIPGNFTIYLTAPGYSVTEDNTQNLTINDTTETVTFSLYSNNSIYITIRNEDTGLIITENITITVTGLNESTYYTTTGYYFVGNLTDGNYTIKFVGDNYTLRTYTVTVAEGSFQYLNAYLTANSDTVIMTYLDEDSGATLEGVSASMSRLIVGVWTVVQSKESDITGRIQFIYTPSVKYKFTASLTGYDEKIFYLDPVIFDEYNVKLSKETTISEAPDYQGVTVTISPSEWFNDLVNNFSITFGSPDGILTTYNYNITAPTGEYYEGSGSNSYGETFDHSVNIAGATFTSTVVINYCYDASITAQKCYTRIYGIRDPDVSVGVFTDNLTEDYGLGVFERILVTVLVTIILTGMLSLFGGILLGAPVGMFIMGYLTYIGFMPLWAALPSFLVAFIILVSRSS